MDTLIEKVRKLLALADSPNENEAALAAEKAQELMLRHGISMAQVASTGKDNIIGVDEATSDGKTTPWRVSLANSIAQSMGGRVVYSNDYGRQSGRIYWFGPAGTVESMIALYRYLEASLVSISAIETAKRPMDIDPWTGKRVHGKTYRSSFLKGAVARLSRRLHERKRAVADEAGTDNSQALVVIKNAVDLKVADKFPRLTTRTTNNSNLDPNAYRKGQEAGASMSLGDRQVGGGRGQLTR